MLGRTEDGNDVYLKDIWPTQSEIAELVEKTVTRDNFQSKYADVFKGDDKWQGVETTDSQDLRLAAHLHLRPEPALLPGHGAKSRAPSRTSKGPRCWRSWVT